MITGIIVDYVPAKECKNEDVWYICYKCGKCGRVFENGFLVDDGGTHPDNDEEVFDECEACENAEWNLVEESWNIKSWEWDYSSLCSECKRHNPEAYEDLYKERTIDEDEGKDY